MAATFHSDLKIFNSSVCSPMALAKCVSFFLCKIILFSSACVSPEVSSKPEEARRPNFLIILADDMGYSDLGTYGGEIATPNLNQLAANGIKFNHFYNAARCCPTRASLLTGLYPHQAGMGGMVSNFKSNPEPGPYQGYLNKQCMTMAEMLKEAGYATYMAGKWHVGEKEEHWPRQRGFDRYFGLISGASSYYEIILHQPMIRQMALDDERWYPESKDFYMTDAFTDYGIQFLEQHHLEQADQPFLLYMAYTAPHWPLHALEEDIARYENAYLGGWDSLRQQRFQRMAELRLIDSTYQLPPREEGVPAWTEVENKADWARRMAVYAAMVDRLDQNIGRLLSTLKEQGELENTVIMFLSDNGASPENVEGRRLNNPLAKVGERGSYVAYDKPWAIASNTPFRRYKAWVEEGGISTPMIIHWPKGITEAGRMVSSYAHIVDVMPTLADLAGTEYPASYQGESLHPLPGQSLRKYLENEEDQNERPLFWEHQGHRAMRQGPWKIVTASPDEKWRLYHMQDDPTELNDLSTQHAERVALMDAAYQAWADSVGVRK
ncbi:MAG: arylsulfatase [Cyclobacteriaceae bacterium]